MPPTIRDAYLFGREHLAASGSSEASIESEVLLRYVLQLDRAALYAGWDRPLGEDAWRRFRSVLDERTTGRPVPYIVGQREFMGLTFAVDERVMIPRPETEVLVEVVVNALEGRELGLQGVEGWRLKVGGISGATRESGSHLQPPASNLQRQLLLVDVGTGSGCIAVSLARLLPQAAVFATDISAEALEVARANAARHGVDGRVECLPGDFLTSLPPQLAGRVDAIVSNPPYVPRTQRDTLPREIRDFEPKVAVFSEGDGLAAHRSLIADAPRWLRPSGLLAMEVGVGQADAASGAMQRDGRYTRIQITPDYGGTPRVVAGEHTAS